MCTRVLTRSLLGLSGDERLDAHADEPQAQLDAARLAAGERLLCGRLGLRVLAARAARATRAIGGIARCGFRLGLQLGLHDGRLHGDAGRGGDPCVNGRRGNFGSIPARSRGSNRRVLAVPLHQRTPLPH